MNYQFENTIEELYSCMPNDRKKFNLIMNSMKRRFLKPEKNLKKKDQTKNQNQVSLPNNNIFSYKPNNKSTPTKVNFDSKLTFRKNEQNLNPNIPINNKNINYNINNYRTQRNFSSDKKLINNFPNKNYTSKRFLGTLPDALLISQRPFRTYSKQKSLLDTHANCNFFYPEKNIFFWDDIVNTGNGWHNQANNIMYNTNDNFYPKN